MRFTHSATARALALSASALSLAFAGTAHAQDAAAEEATGGISEIVVTAQKVKENVQDVPIAITALTADRLESTGTTSLEGLTQLVPSVTFRKGVVEQGGTVLFFRLGYPAANLDGSKLEPPAHV